MLPNRRISDNLAGQQRKVLGQDAAKNSLPISQLFKENGLYFWVDESIRRLLNTCLRNVINNGGQSLKNLQCIADKSVTATQVFCIIPDGQTELIQEIGKIIGKEKAVFVSPRWVEYCTDRNNMVKNPVGQKLYHLLPFPHPTPYKDLKGVRVFINPKIEFDLRVTIQGCLKAMGGTLVTHASEG